MRKIIWHGLTRRWVQSLATLLAVAASVAVFFALFLIYQGVSLGLEKSADRMGADILVVPSEAQVQSEQLLFTGAPVCVYMDKHLEEKIAELPGVQQVTVQFFAQTLPASCCSTTNPTRIIGFDPESDWMVKALAQKLAKGGIAPGQILIGSEVLGFTGKNTYILGERVHVASVLEPTGTSFDQSILVPIGMARKMAESNEYFKHFWDEYGQPDQLISALLIKTNDNVQQEELTRAIIKMGNYRVIQSSETLQKTKAQMKILFIVMLCAGLVTVVALALQFFARFFSLAWDRKGEWGLYRALGATRQDLKLLIIGEALTLTLGGLVVGLLLGYGLYAIIINALRKQQTFPMVAPSAGSILWGILILMVFFGLLGGLSAWFPARQSAKIEPSAAMALDDID